MDEYLRRLEASGAQDSEARWAVMRILSLQLWLKLFFGQKAAFSEQGAWRLARQRVARAGPADIIGRMKIACRIAMALLPLLAWISSAAGADDGYTPPEAKPDMMWVCWAATAVFVAALAVVAFKGAKRTHLD